MIIRFVGCGLLWFSTGLSANGSQHLNIIVIMTDNHGPWSLGCYGQEVIEDGKISGEWRQVENRTHYIEAFLCRKPDRARTERGNELAMAVFGFTLTCPESS